MRDILLYLTLKHGKISSMNSASAGQAVRRDTAVEGIQEHRRRDRADPRVGAAVYILLSEEKGGDGGGIESDLSGVVINEFMASNGGCLPDKNGEYRDWIEIYNTTGQTVDLYGYGLSDSNSQRPGGRFRVSGLKRADTSSYSLPEREPPTKTPYTSTQRSN